MNLSILSNDKAKLAFQRHTKLTVDDPKQLSWAALHETRKSLVAACETMLNRCESENNRELNDSEKLAMDYGMSMIDSINLEFDQRDKRGIREPDEKPVAIRSIPFQGYAQSIPAERTIRPGVSKYNDLFGNHSDRDFAGTSDEFFGILERGSYDPRMERRAAVEGVGALGGFAVPAQTASQIYDIALESEIVRPRALVLPVQFGSSLSIPLWNNESHSSGLANLQGVWMAEEATNTPQDPALKLIKLELQKLAIFADVSNELMSDGINLASQLSMQLSKVLSFNLDESFLTGNGVARPEGVQKSSACIKVARAVSSQIAYADVMGIFARLYPGSWANAVWVASPSTIPQLADIKDSGNHNLWIQSVQENMPGSLLGRPLFFSEKVAELGGEGDIGLYDFSQYCIIMRQEIAVQKSDNPQWYKDLTSFRAIVRINGKSLWPTALTPKNGSTTLSPFVILQ